ncbi:MAG TPA: hypothetical protein DD435_10125 [Cyanobacteria bacterium UBA8530]|nr:hypothetical protein [Cyanobacteria bacterium UBA8530]
MDVSLMGCLVTDLRTGGPLGRIRKVLFDPNEERIESLAAETILPNQGHPLVGQRLFGSEGSPIGTVVDVIAVLPEDQSGVRRVFLWLQPAEGQKTELSPSAEEESPYEANDYMVGQISLSRLSDKEGRTLISPGETITLEVVRQAKRLGLLNRLESRFP